MEHGGVHDAAIMSDTGLIVSVCKNAEHLVGKYDFSCWEKPHSFSLG